MTTPTVKNLAVAYANGRMINLDPRLKFKINGEDVCYASYNKDTGEYLFLNDKAWAIANRFDLDCERSTQDLIDMFGDK